MGSWKGGYAGSAMLVLLLGAVHGAAQTVPAAAGAGPGGTAAAGSTSCHTVRSVDEAERALAREDYDAAERRYTERRATDPETARAGLIRVLLARDKVDEAQVAAEDWAKEAPRNALAQETLGEVDLRAGNIRPAYEQARTALGLDPCVARTYLLLSEMEDLAANFARSRRHVVLANQLAPADPEIHRAWLDTLPRGKRLEQLAALSTDETEVSAEKRQRLARYLQRAAQDKPHPCEVVGEVGTVKMPMQRLLGGPMGQGS